MKFAARLFLTVSKIAFAFTVFLAPMRWRIVLESRPFPMIYKDFTDFLLFGSDISMLLLFIFWGVSLLLVRRSLKFGPLFIWTPLLAIVFAGFASAFSSLDGKLSLYHVIRLLGMFLFYLYIVNEITSPMLFIVSIVSQLIFQSIYAILQFILQNSIGLQVLGEHILEPSSSGVSIVSDGTERLLRSYGLAEHPNILGGCLAFSLVVVLGIYLYGNRKGRKGLALIFLTGLFALFFTFSRSAFLAFLAGSGFIFIENIVARRWDNLKSLALLVLISLLCLSSFVYQYFDFLAARVNIGNSFQNIQAETLSVQERLALNQLGLQIFLKEPFHGVGIGASPLGIKNYFPNFRGHFLPPHLSLLAVAMETGIPGLICYLLLLASPLLMLILQRRDLKTNPDLIIATAVLASVTVAGFFDIYPWLLLPGRLWHWSALGFWAVACEKHKT